MFKSQEEFRMNSKKIISSVSLGQLSLRQVSLVKKKHMLIVLIILLRQQPVRHSPS